MQNRIKALAVNERAFARFVLNRGLGWEIAGRIGTQVVQIGTTVVLARMLSPSDYGRMALLESVLAVWLILADGGLSTALIQKQDADRWDYAAAFCFNVSWSILLAVGLHLAACCLQSMGTSASGSLAALRLPGNFTFLRLYEEIRRYTVSTATCARGTSVNLWLILVDLVLLLNALSTVPRVWAVKHYQFRRLCRIEFSSRAAAALIAIGMARRGAGVRALIMQKVVYYGVESSVLWIRLPEQLIKKLQWKDSRNQYAVDYKVYKDYKEQSGLRKTRELACEEIKRTGFPFCRNNKPERVASIWRSIWHRDWLDAQHRSVFNALLLLWKALFCYGWKLMLSSLLDTGYSSLRVQLLGQSYPAADLAFWNRGEKIPRTLTEGLNSSLERIMLPMMADRQNDPRTVGRMAGKMALLGVAIEAPVLGLVAFFADDLVGTVLSAQWLPCVPYLRICCLIYLLYPIHTASLIAIKALGRSDLILRLEIFKKAIGLGIFLVAVRISMKAVACGLLIAGVCGAGVNVGMARKATVKK